MVHPKDLETERENSRELPDACRGTLSNGDRAQFLVSAENILEKILLDAEDLFLTET